MLIEGGEIPSIGGKVGLFCTSPRGQMLYVRFSAIHV